MKIYSAVLFLLSSVCVHATETWVVENSGTSATLLSIHCPSIDTCYTVGEQGVVLKTVNGGTTWAAQTSGKSSALSSVHFVDASTGYIVGDGGAILKTVNGGVSWSSQSSSTSKSLTSISCRKTSTCFAAANGGAIVNLISEASVSIDPAASSQKTAIQFVSDDLGFAVVEHDSTYSTPPPTVMPVIKKWVVLYKTRDSGSTWTDITRLEMNFSGYCFADSNVGYMVSSDYLLVFKTLNGGGSWNSQSSSTNSGLNGVYFTSENFGYAVGSSGTLLKTANGTNWGIASSGTGNDLYSVYFLDQNNGYAVGYNGTIIKKTEDGIVSIRNSKSLNTHMILHATIDPWYGFQLPDNRVFNILGRRPSSSQSFSIPDQNPPH